jgi:hypothetical protein
MGGGFNLHIHAGHPGHCGTAPLPLRSATSTSGWSNQGDLVSPETLDFYHYMLEPFLGWLENEHPERSGFEDLDVNLVNGDANEPLHFQIHLLLENRRLPR